MTSSFLRAKQPALHSSNARQTMLALTVAAPVDQHGLSVVLGDETREAKALAVRDHSNAL